MTRKVRDNTNYFSSDPQSKCRPYITIRVPTKHNSIEAIRKCKNVHNTGLKFLIVFQMFNYLNNIMKIVGV